MLRMFVIVMGVSGSGKTTVGVALAQAVGCPFYDGDDFHPPDNVAKMAAGSPLDDDDRVGWLASLANVIRSALSRGENGVIACSALKNRYRSVLQAAAPDPRQVRFVYLKGDYAAIFARMQGRYGHYMKSGMLQSQFDALEEPDDVTTVDIALELDEKIRQIMEQLMDPTTRASVGAYALDGVDLGVTSRSLTEMP